jgi:hypothetical protein
MRSQGGIIQDAHSSSIRSVHPAQYLSRSRGQRGGISYRSILGKYDPKFNFNTTKYSPKRVNYPRNYTLADLRSFDLGSDDGSTKANVVFVPSYIPYDRETYEP